MANPEKGEVDLVVDKKTYTLCMGSNALVQIEQVLGREQDIATILTNMQTAPRLEVVRAVLWGALLKFQPQTTLLDAGDLMDEVGPDGMAGLGEKLSEAIRFRLSGPRAGATVQ